MFRPFFPLIPSPNCTLFFSVFVNFIFSDFRTILICHHTHTHTHTHTEIERNTHTYTHTYAREGVYGICHPEFLQCNCQTVNPGKQICINFVKLIHKFHLRSFLIVEKGTFNVLIAQLIEFQNEICAKFQNSFVGTLKLMIPGLLEKLHPVINKNAFPRK